MAATTAAMITIEMSARGLLVDRVAAHGAVFGLQTLELVALGSQVFRAARGTPADCDSPDQVMIHFFVTLFRLFSELGQN